MGEALSPFAPVGYAAMAQRGGGEAAPSSFSGGMARLDGTPATRQTIFRVASVSKIFTAAAALTLVEAGGLSLDDPIADALGYAAGDITLRQLLTHTAGLDDRLAYNRAVSMAETPPLSEVLRASHDGRAPGTAFRYSNLGAGVAGMLVEAASGMPFDDYVRQTFFIPHGIDASFHPQRIARGERMASCYRVPGGALAYDAQAIAAQPLDDSTDPERHYAVPAGKLMISAEDLLTSLQRLMRRQPAMFVRQAHAGSVRCDAGRGLGLSIAPKGVLAKGRAFWGHQGVAYGAMCQAWMDPASGDAAVLLTNGIRLNRIGPLYRAGQRGMAALLDRPAGAEYTSHTEF